MQILTPDRQMGRREDKSQLETRVVESVVTLSPPA